MRVSVFCVGVLTSWFIYANFAGLRMEVTMYSYNPGVFASEFNTRTGHEIWDFLNLDENIVRMKTATALQRPAVEGLEEPLLATFGARIMPRRVKQMAGHMVRQIMEREGYVLDVQDVKVTNGGPFSRASRYKGRDEMTFHVFQNSADPRTLALTADNDGASLPNDKPRQGARWTYWKSFRGGLRGRIAFALNDEMAARKDIAHQGYHIYRMQRILRSA